MGAVGGVRFGGYLCGALGHNNDGYCGRVFDNGPCGAWSRGTLGPGRVVFDKCCFDVLPEVSSGAECMVGLLAMCESTVCGMGGCAESQDDKLLVVVE